MKNSKMRKVAQQIIEVEISPKTKKTIMDKFYNIMRENGIKQGEWDEIGRTCNNFEWTMCKSLFIDRIISYLDLYDFFNTPENLLGYGDEPEKKIK